MIQKYGSSLFVLSTVLLFFVIFSPSLAFAEVDTDKLVYTKGELVKISGTLDLQDDNEQVNIVEIEIFNSNNDTIVTAYTPVNDNEFSSSYNTITWTPGDYKVTINYNDVEDSTEFEVVSSSEDDDGSNASEDVADEESKGDQQNSSSATLSDTVPDSPIDLKANVISATQIDLSWSIPDENDSSITGFKIEARTNTDPNYSVIMENTGNNDTVYSHTGLTPDTVYAYRVYAINSAGESEPSSSTTVKTSSSSISSQNSNIEDADVPTGLMARIISPTSIELSWNPPTQTYGQIIQNYVIKQEIASGVYNEIANTVGSVTYYTVSDLTTNESYTFMVAANYLRGSSDFSKTTTVTLSSSSSSTSNNSNDDDDSSNSAAPNDVPDPPTDLKTRPVLSTQIDLSWSAPESDSDNNNSITGYKIEVRPTNDSFYSTVIEDTENTDTAYSHTGLIPNTTYIYRVYAINDIGTSEPSGEQLVNTLITDPEEESDSSTIQDNNDNANNDTNISPSTNIPGQPVDLQAIPISQNRINLSWSAPIDSGLSSPLLGYKIESKTSEESDYSILVTNTGNASITSYFHTGLTAELTYQYRVSAINSSGESVPSDVVEATIVSADSVQTTDESQSQQSSTSLTLQPLQVTLSTDKSVYGPNDSIEISGISNNPAETIPLGLRVISSDDVIVYARSISINNDNSFEAIISPLQRQSSVWQIGGEFTVEVTYNGRIQATTTFMNDGNDNAGNSLPTSNESNNDTTGLNEQSSSQLSSQTSSTNDPIVASNNELETLKNQNIALQSANQQLHNENNQLKTQIDDLNKKVEQLDMIVKEQIRVMLEHLGIS